MGRCESPRLGCGPPREVVDYLTIPALPRHRVEVTLIDQDHAGLARAYERALPEIMRRKGRATMRCLHSSFTEFLKVGALFDKLPPQNSIYSVGLIDYLTSRLSKALVESLYERLAPGSRLIIGNIKALERVLAAGFGRRRKMLRQSLKPLDRDVGALLAAAAEPTARVEELSVPQFCTLARAYDGLGTSSE
jgi:hypothetical protein